MKYFFSVLLQLSFYYSLFAQQQIDNEASSLFTNSKLVENTKIRIKNLDATTNNWSNLQNKCKLYLKEKLEIPTRGGNWEQYYINPVTNNSLAREKQIGNWRWQHIDSKTYQPVTSDSTQIDKDYDGVVIGLIHNNWALGAMELGLAYQLNNDKEYLQKTKQILLNYAAIYSNLPERTRSNGKLAAAGFGRIHVQDLNEAQWLVNITLAASFIWDKLSNKERKTITTQLFYPAIETINKRKAEISNIQCWRNTATGLVGFLVKDNSLIDLAINSEFGFNSQLKNGFNEDGFTKDYSPNYQFFALHPLVLLANAAINSNYKAEVGLLQNMFLTPLQMSTKDLLLPAFNDSRTIQLNEFSYLYEWAYFQFKNDNFLEVINNTNKKSNNVDNGYKFTAWNLIFNTEFKKTTVRTIQSKKWDNSGIAILCAGENKNKLYCFTKYANQIANLRHVQNAQLDFSIIKNNEFISTMQGNPNYASSLSDEWFRSGVAHNTLLYNENEQRRSSGKCLGFGTTNEVDYIVTATANFYVHDAAFVRTIAAINENTILIIDQFRSTKPENGIFDLFYHQEGSLLDNINGTKWIAPQIQGYKNLSECKIDSNKLNFSIKTKLRSEKIITTLGVASQMMNVVTGYGYSFHQTKVPMKMLRFNTESTEAITVAYCISLDGRVNKITLGQNTNSNKKALLGNLTIENTDGSKIKVVFNADKQEFIENNITSKSIFEVYK